VESRTQRFPVSGAAGGTQLGLVAPRNPAGAPRVGQGVGISGGGAVEGDALHKSEPSEQF